MSDYEDVSEQSSQRKRPTPSPTASAKKARKSQKSPGGETASSTKSNRGLRHFSMMVCQKVEERGTTTYNEVADELVKKVLAEREEKENGSTGKFDEKNIRRRVYDALNVLMAMDIISKEKKDITWKGLPHERQDLDSLTEEVRAKQDQIQEKREALRELLVQQVCFRNLIAHNHQRGISEEKIPLPFIVVNTHNSAVIQCDMSRDRTDVMLDFSMPFEINDDNTILKKMGMDKTSSSVLRDMLPDDLMAYCADHGLLDAVTDGTPPPFRHSPEPHPLSRQFDPQHHPYHHRSDRYSQRPPQHHEYGYHHHDML